MNIFNAIIADHLIGGISELETIFHEPSDVSFSFRIFLPKYEAVFRSDKYAGSVESPEKEAWLKRYYQVKADVAKLFGETVNNDEFRTTAINDSYIALKTHLDKVFELLALAGPTLNMPVNTHIERVHIEAAKLKNLAIG